MAAIEQTIHVKGQVVDATGEPVIGANVIVKGTTTGVISDINGDFTIDAPKNAVLLVSFIGYKSQEVKVTGPSIKITLADDTEMLDEVVVVGYGSQKKSNITGAMVNVKSEALQQAPVGSIGAALQGLAAGVDVQMAGGNTHPGASPQIRVRGERSLKGGNDVLIVVDGIPFSGGLNEISNDDVESISVLKDASATAIYGSRGANGVLLITTKRGNKGKTSVSYSGYYGFTTAIKKYDAMNSSEYITLKKNGLLIMVIPMHTRVSMTRT
ncbi:MAG: carboxypeptidase-like regulatory domain-containing protein [Bacteroides sp.]|nr:carboxypeptidase-like regulatory domain-containing protein [Bacteroides sp.]